MNWFICFFRSIVDTMDQHEGMVAMVGIAVTVFIFMREVSNNYFTMERDNFNDIFKELIMKQLPEKLSMVEQAKEAEWSEKYDELLGVLDKMLIDSKYYKYSIPFFYKCLCLRVDEITDLRRHDNWRLYRSAEKQNRLVQMKCRAMIRNINNASKGRIFAIRCYQNGFYQKIRGIFVKQWIDRPADRITEKYLQGDIGLFEMSCGGEAIDFNNVKKLNLGNLTIKSAKQSIIITDAICVEKSEMFFGYKWNFRWGKTLGIITINSKRDNSVRVNNRKRNELQLVWNDSNVHKVVLMWHEENDRQHVYFKEFNMRTIS